MRATERAYLAGIVDGEGSIMLTHRPRADRKWKHIEAFALRIMIANTNRALIDWIATRFPEGGITATRPGTRGHKPCYHWRAEYRTAARLLSEIKPYVVVKKGQVAIALSFLSTISRRRVGRRGYPEEIARIRSELASRLHSLNRRGPDPA